MRPAVYGFPRRPLLKLSEKPDRLGAEASEVDENGSKKPYFAAQGIKNGGFRGYSRPLSDGFSRQLGE